MNNKLNQIGSEVDSRARRLKNQIKSNPNQHKITLKQFHNIQRSQTPHCPREKSGKYKEYKEGFPTQIDTTMNFLRLRFFFSPQNCNLQHEAGLNRMLVSAEVIDFFFYYLVIVSSFVNKLETTRAQTRGLTLSPRDTKIDSQALSN